MDLVDQQIVSWDGHYINDGVDYTAGFRPGLQWGLPSVAANLVGRTGRWPLVGGLTRPGVRLYVMIVIKDTSNTRVLRDQLCAWFDPEDETPKLLVIEDATGGPGYLGDDRYVYAICEALQPVVSQNLAADEAFMATLVVHGDVRWRGTWTCDDVWAITASGQTRVITNDGTDEAYPIFIVEPTNNKTGDYAYKRFIPRRWRVSAAYTNYPEDICDDNFDTQALIPAKMQADGDDLRVWVDGVEVDRWLDGINTATTKVWINLDYQPKWDGTITSAIGALDTVETLDVNEDITAAPSSGILVIDTGANYEVFTYTSKNNSLRRFLGMTRAAKGTGAIAHNANDVIWWCQHDIWILYGNAGVSAPVVDGDYEPAFELDHSVNTSWVYEEFGEDDGLRPGQWVDQVIANNPVFYGGNRGAAADPWIEVGLKCDGNDKGRRYLYNPCGVTNANFTNGEKYSDFVAFWSVLREKSIQSSINGTSWTTEYQIPAPSTDATWEAWNRNEALVSGSQYVGLLNEGSIAFDYIEAADCTVTLNSSNTPIGEIGAEQGNYTLDVELENVTTGQSIQVTYTMALNQELEIDTDHKTVTDLEDGTSQYQAKELVGEVRREWLPLLPGNNTLRWTDAGTTGVTLTTEWEDRFY